MVGLQNKFYLVVCVHCTFLLLSNSPLYVLLVYLGNAFKFKRIKIIKLNSMNLDIGSKLQGKPRKR